MARFKALHIEDEFIIPGLILKVKPYIYGDKKTLAEPDCDVRIHADIWVTTGKWKSDYGSKPSMLFYARVRVDFDNMLFYEPKTGKQIPVSNAEIAIEAIREALEPKEPKEEKDD